MISLGGNTPAASLRGWATRHGRERIKIRPLAQRCTIEITFDASQNANNLF